MKLADLFQILTALALAPLLSGVINRTKAFFAGRRGMPFLQAYYDLWKLLKKGVVVSRTTTFMFWLGPLVFLAVCLLALLITPFGTLDALISFKGDFILFVYLFALARFLMILSALDTGSSFEGMGASREARFAVFAEPALFLGLGALAYETKSLSLSGIYPALSYDMWLQAGPVMALVGAAFFIVFLAETARVPVDDPRTHLELTMIHEVMILDHSGPDLACFHYAASLKFWILGSLIAGLFFPVRFANPFMDILVFTAALFLLAVLVGVIESVLARLRLLKIPGLLVMASGFSILALIVAMR